MLDSAPRPCLSILGLLEAVTDYLGFRWRKRFIPVDKTLGLHRDAPPLRRNFHKVPFLKFHSVKNLFWYDNLATLTDTAERGCPAAGDLDIAVRHIFSLSYMRTYRPCF